MNWNYAQYGLEGIERFTEFGAGRKGVAFFLSCNTTSGKPGQMVAEDLRRCRIERVKNPVRTEELQWK
jgi:hypothetical protein